MARSLRPKALSAKGKTKSCGLIAGYRRACISAQCRSRSAPRAACKTPYGQRIPNCLKRHEFQGETAERT